MCDGPEEPPPGRFGFKKHAGLIRVNVNIYPAYQDLHSMEGLVLLLAGYMQLFLD